MKMSLTKTSWTKEQHDQRNREKQWAARYNCPYCGAEKPILTLDGKTDKTLKAKESKHRCRKCNAEWQWYTNNQSGVRVKTTRLDTAPVAPDPFAGIEVQSNLMLLMMIESTLEELVDKRELSLKYSPYDLQRMLYRLIKLGWAESYDIVEGKTVYPMARASDIGRSVYNNRQAVPLASLIVML